MIQIQDKNVENQVYFPKSTNIEGDLVLRLHSELTQKDYTFDVVNESKTSNYYKFNVNFKSVENGEYTYFINDTDSGLIRIGNVDEAVSTSTYIDGIEVVQYYPQDVKETDYSKEPLTFKILSAGTINWTASNTGITKTIEYKLNDGEWISITSNTGETAPTINVAEGDKIQFRGNNAQYATGTSAYNSFSGSTALFEAEGNIMSLIYGDEFKNNSTISSTYTFNGLFRDCAKLVSAENLILPATTLKSYCYQYMFRGCKSLTTAPELPATTLANYCYSNMFGSCTSLTTAPVLPATTLEQYCYYNMFQYCSKLTTAPELPATTLANYCYAGMLQGCTSLTTAPALPATTLANSCYSEMFNGCSSLTVAPELPATTLVEDCYHNMFKYCTKLSYIKCLATDISAPYCTSYWVEYIASTGTFVKNPNMTSWTTGTSGIPRGWIVQDA